MRRTSARRVGRARVEGGRTRRVRPSREPSASLLSPHSAIALGMVAYVRAGFCLRIFGAERLRTDPGTIVAPSHRSDNDVPVLIAALYARWARAVHRGRPW